jgi:photosystem II stability/assembly factor-like uncharacterized protein
MLRLTAMPTASKQATSTPVITRAVQTAESGAIQVADGDGGASVLPHQPPLSSPHLASTVSGWWVCGADSDTGMPVLAVSRDDGATWELHPMGVDRVDAPPALVAQGDTVYLLASSHHHLTLQKSTDSGRSWSALPGASGWPAATRYGLVAAQDKSLVAWLSTNSGTVLMRSKDGGVTFAPYHAPGTPAGPIVTVSDGYLMLGSQPALSRDGVTWTAVTVPWLPLR